MKKTHSVDMTQGNIFKLIILFSLPIMATGILQLLYNAADMVVVGRFASKNALAAVGSTASAINIIVNTFVGMSSASNVIIARKFGANNKSGVSHAVHTAMALSVVGGILMAAIGILVARPMMLAMGSPEEVIDLSVLYMRIYFAGIPVIMIYNFGSSILRAIGDTTRPLYYLTGSGLVNIGLNLIFVIVFHMSVAGVALATVISQAVAAALVVRCLVKTDECYKLVIKNIRFHANELRDILYLGIPAGLQSSIFSLSNIIIQSSINSVGSIAMAGNAAGVSIEGITYISMNSIHQGALTFISQNYGACNFNRIKKGILSSAIVVTVTGFLTSGVICLFAPWLVSIYSDSAEVIACGSTRLYYVCALYFLCGLMEVGVSGLRGLGTSLTPLIISVSCVCGVRILMVMLGAPYNTMKDLNLLYISYPVSWFVTAVMHYSAFGIVLKKKIKESALKE